MKTFLLVCLTVIASIILLANIGPLIMLFISVALAYYGIRKFILSETTSQKVGWGIVILIGISMSLSNIPALIGIVALAVLYYTYKKWKQEKTKLTYQEEDLNLDKL